MKILVLLFILFPTLSLAKSIEKIDYQLINFEHVGGVQPANEIVLEGEQKAWVHGCKSGSSVTINGTKASVGEYKIKNMNQVMRVDERGNLMESIESIKHVLCTNS